MSKYMVGYCWNCAKRTKHKVIEPVESTAWKVFETIATLGFALLLLPYQYECECMVCGNINTLTKE